jgi:hypothetical protein
MLKANRLQWMRFFQELNRCAVLSANRPNPEKATHGVVAAPS